MHESRPELPRQPSRKLRLLLWLLNPKVGIPLAMLLALIAAPFMYRMHRINMLPDIGDPFDVEAFGTVEITEAENAFVEYEAASKLLVELKSAFLDEHEKAIDEGWSAASENIRNWVEVNRPALELWRKGTEKPDALYNQPKDADLSSSLPPVQKLRDFARLVQIEGLRLEEAGELEEAWKLYRALYRNSRHCGRHGTVIERHVGIAIHSLSSQSIEKWSRNTQVSNESLKKAIIQLQADYRLTAPTSEVLKVEYLLFKNSLLSENVHEYVAEESDIPLPLGKTTLFFLGEPELSWRVMQHVWKNRLAEIDKPLHQRSHLSSDTLALLELKAPTGKDSLHSSPQEINEAFNSSIFARLLMPYTPGEAVRREQLRHRALLVALAAQWYRRERGEFPEKIEDLLEGYLDEIPLDPHDAKGGKLRYRRNPDGFTVWGLGANGRDDGGKIGWDPEEDDFGYHVGKEEQTDERD